MEESKLYAIAQEAALSAYAPYSNFRVGAALVCSDGTVFKGVNVENRSFGLTVCAERNAVAAALVAGRKDFTAIAVATPDAAYPVSPCGACRQVLSEFGGSDFRVIFGNAPDSLVRTDAEKLFPHDSLHELKAPGASNGD